MAMVVLPGTAERSSFEDCASALARGESLLPHEAKNRDRLAIVVTARFNVPPGSDENGAPPAGPVLSSRCAGDRWVSRRRR